jgi:hypothetical protein
VLSYVQLTVILGVSHTHPGRRIPANWAAGIFYTKEIDHLKSPEMPDHPSLIGTINVTMQLIEDPKFSHRFRCCRLTTLPGQQFGGTVRNVSLDLTGLSFSHCL